jgi:iron complex transport system substrate-binding protein
MGQRPARAWTRTLLATAIVAVVAGAGCERKTSTTALADGTGAAVVDETSGAAPHKDLQRRGVSKEPTVASLSPAATDIVLGIGAGDHLAAVSNYDSGREEIAGLPRVGDYRTQDWEKLAALRPGRMIIQLHPDRTPAGLRDRAKGLGIELVNVQIDDLEDVLAAIPKIAEAAGEPEKGAAALKTLRGTFDTVRARVKDRPKVRTLVVVDVGGRSVAGPGTFLHDILTAAGGENAAAELGNPWPTVDREKIAQLKPEAVIHLLPQASPQTKAQAEQFWAAMPNLPAVKNKRVHYLTDWFVLLPGYHLGDLAEQFALVLHPFANVGPLNPQAPSPGGAQLDSLPPSR